MKVLSGSRERVVARKGNYKVLEIIDFRGVRRFYLMNKGGVLMRQFSHFDQAHEALTKMARNPGTNWHVDRANALMAQKGYGAQLQAQENFYAANEGRRLGMNPIRHRKGSKGIKGLLPIALIGGLAWLILRK